MKTVTLQVTDGRGSPYTIKWPCRRTGAGWINSRKGNPLEGHAAEMEALLLRTAPMTENSQDVPRGELRATVRAA
jgi:hypothetical protein